MPNCLVCLPKKYDVTLGHQALVHQKAASITVCYGNIIWVPPSGVRRWLSMCRTCDVRQDFFETFSASLAMFCQPHPSELVSTCSVHPLRQRQASAKNFE